MCTQFIPKDKTDHMENCEHAKILWTINALWLIKLNRKYGVVR